MRNQQTKLVLNQEILRNLTAGELRVVVGGSALNTCVCPTTTQAYSCIECPPPPPDIY